MRSILKLNFLVIIILSSCIGAGTLGGFEKRMFPASKRVLVNAIDTLYAQFPDYKIPDKWKSKDDWKERGYDFLDTRIFYFKDKPEEMYYVSFFGDANDSVQVDTFNTGIAIRAINNGRSWSKEESYSTAEKERIESRFDNEIISKLELYINNKSIREK